MTDKEKEVLIEASIITQSSIEELGRKLNEELKKYRKNIKDRIDNELADGGK